MDRRIPAARNAQRIAVNPFDRSIALPNINAFQTQPPPAAGHHCASIKRVIAQGLRLGAAVNHGHNLNTRLSKISRRAMRIGVIAKDRHPLAGAYPKAVEVAAHGACCHDAGAIIICKGDLPLQSTRA